jgi:Spy/CpxP family protein refolding chaperone
MKMSRVLVLVGGMFLLVQGCASANRTAEENLNQKLASETPVTSLKDLRKETNQVLANTTGLTPDQKDRLAALRTETDQAVDANREMSRKLRSILVKDLVAQNYDEKEVSLIKRKLSTLESDRIEITFKAVDQANTILGRDAAKNRVLVDSFFDRHNHTD